MPEEKKLTAADFKEAFGENISTRLQKRIEELDIRYRELSSEERDEAIRIIVDALVTPRLDRSGDDKLPKWEKGWGENLSALKENKADALKPIYFNKDTIARWQGRLIKPLAPGWDYNALTIITEWLFEKYFSQTKLIHEFGCGTGHHLLRLRSINPDAKLIGLDWAEASQQIIGELKEQGTIDNIEGRRFDFFNPDKNLVIEEGSGVYTIAALEQVGENHRPFIEYLLKYKPSVCVHIEPMAEFLDPNSLLDYLVIAYYKRRNYLWGFYDALKKLEEEEKIDIHLERRTGIGGNLFIEGYMVVVWSPKK